jgi:anti-sigma factor RsiW
MKALGLISCARVQQKLEALADGELRGAELLMVSRHVEMCDICEALVSSVRATGESLREAATAGVVPMMALAGLADGVVSRVRAEEAQSWSAKLARALDDCHWLLVGVGSMSAALLSVMLVCAMLQVGIPARPDSMAALVTGLSPSMDVSAAAELTAREGEGAIARATVNRFGRVTHLQLITPGDAPWEFDGVTRDYRQKLGLWSDRPQETRTVWIVNTNSDVRRYVRTSVLE